MMQLAFEIRVTEVPSRYTELTAEERAAPSPSDRASRFDI